MSHKHEAVPRIRTAGLSLALLAAAAVIGALSLALGSVGWSWPWAANDPLAQQIVWEVRAPRAAAALLAGALLGLSGAIAQGLFRNPLADPFLLGSAAGAGLGVALCLALTVPAGLAIAQAMGQPMVWPLQLAASAFVGSLVAVWLTLLLARGVQNGLRLLLAGVVVGVVLGAVGSLVTVLVPRTLAPMQAFALGATALVDWPGNRVMLAAWLLALPLGLAHARSLDALTLGADTAASLGVRLVRLRWTLVGALSLAAGAAVSQVGLVAFVGLVAPHLVRALAPGGHARGLWLSSLMGACLLMAADLLARVLLMPLELPVGVLTAILGGGYLLWLMHRRPI